MSVPEKRLIRSKSGLRIMPIKDSERSPFELQEPEWIKDNQCSSCHGCKSNFDFVRRKHHCRRCGQIYCNACTKTKLALPRMCFLDPVRMCSPCALRTSEENTFYEKDLKILTAGVLLQVSEVFPDSKTRTLHCCLSLNHCHLLLSGSVSQSIPLVNIKTVANLKDDEGESMERLSFVVSGESVVTELQVPPDSPGVSSGFISSLNKAFQMAQEARSIIGTGM